MRVGEQDQLKRKRTVGVPERRGKKALLVKQGCFHFEPYLACEWEHPRTPLVRLLWDVRAAGAVLEFLRTTRVGCIGMGRTPPEDGEEDTEGEGAGQGRPRVYGAGGLKPGRRLAYSENNEASTLE